MLKVLITRPLPQAETLADMVRALGAYPLVFPTLEIQKIPPSPPFPTGGNRTADIAIFTSVHAVMPVPAKKMAAIGTATARALEAQGMPVHYLPSHFSSEGLLATLPSVRAKTILLVKGEGGRAVLAQSLRAQGAKVTEIAVYRRQKPTCMAVDYRPADVILCTSYEGLQNLMEMVDNTWLLAKPLIVGSERLAKFARAMGFTHAPLVADNATDVALCNALNMLISPVLGS